MIHNRMFACTVLLALCACPGDGGGEALGTRLELTGSFKTTGTWDLRGPLGSGHSPGDLIADLVLEELVERLGVPELAREKAFELLSELGHGSIAAQVNGTLPENWQRGGSTRKALAMSLGSVVRETELSLSLAENSIGISGRSELTALTIAVEGQDYTLPLAQVFGANADLAAALDGEALSDDMFRLDEHGYSLEFTGLVNWILTEGLGLDLISLRDEVREQVDCPGLIAQVTDDQGELRLEVKSIEYTVASGAIGQICPAIEELIVDAVLGRFETGTSLSFRGRVYSDDDDADGVVDSLRSHADFSGHYRGFPGPIDPVVAASFTGSR